MEKPVTELLVTLNENYLPQLRVMLTSLFLNSPGSYRVYLLHSSIPREQLERLGRGVEQAGSVLCPYAVDGGVLEGAPVTKQYPKEMYYRLLAAHILPEELKKVLYLDPDTLIINSIQPLWDLDMGGKLFAAAAHTGKTELANNVNKLRLGTEGKYFNSGVMLMDLDKARERIRPEEIFSFAEEHSAELLLPDQDILNILYENEILEIDDFIWNYDARKFSSYFLRSAGETTMEWVMRNTAILHFCGKAKPWKQHYAHRFGILYQHYMRLAERYWGTAD